MGGHGPPTTGDHATKESRGVRGEIWQRSRVFRATTPGPTAWWRGTIGQEGCGRQNDSVSGRPSSSRWKGRPSWDVAGRVWNWIAGPIPSFRPTVRLRDGNHDDSGRLIE